MARKRTTSMVTKSTPWVSARPIGEPLLGEVWYQWDTGCWGAFVTLGVDVGVVVNTYNVTLHTQSITSKGPTAPHRNTAGKFATAKQAVEYIRVVANSGPSTRGRTPLRDTLARAGRLGKYAKRGVMVPPCFESQEGAATGGNEARVQAFGLACATCVYVGQCVNDLAQAQREAEKQEAARRAKSEGDFMADLQAKLRAKYGEGR